MSQKVRIMKGKGGRIKKQFPYNPTLVKKIKTLKRRRWHQISGHKDIMTTEIYTYVSTKNLRKIISPIDTLNLDEGGEKQPRSARGGISEQFGYHPKLSSYANLSDITEISEIII